MKALLVGVLVTPGVLIGIGVISIWRAWWLLPAWGWFAVPLGLPPVTFWPFFGILIFLSALRSSPTNEVGEKDDWKAQILNAFIGPPSMWTGMWLAHWMAA